MKAQAIGRNAVMIVDNIMNLIMLTIILLLIAFTGYVLWDLRQL